MAKDDLSVNINVGVNLDKASLDNTNEQIEKLEANIDRLNAKKISPRVDLRKEFQKELGFGQGVKVQVGGYSPGSMTNKAKADAAQSANRFAQELTQMLGIEFISEFTKTVGEKEFKVPGLSNRNAQLTPTSVKSTESLFKNIDTSNLLSSPITAGPKYQQAIQQATEDFIVTAANNVVISPAMAIAALDRAVAKNPGAYMEGNLPGRTSGIIKPTPAFGETANFDQEVTNKFNNFLDSAIGENQGAADRVSQFLESKLKVLFSKIIDEGQKARERTFTGSRVSEGDDAAEGLVRYADDAARKAMASMEQRLGLQAGSTALYGAAMVPEKFRARPEAKSDPAALLNVLIGEYQDEVTGALMASLPDPSQVANPIAQVLMNPYILGDKFATGYEQEVGKLLKSKAATTADVVTPVAEPAKGGALNPNIEMLRKYLSEQKALVEAEGKTFMAGLDTEFNSQIDEKLTELGIVIEDGTGKFVEIFKFLQLPNDLQALEAGGRMLPPGSVKTPKDLLKRGDVLGIPKENIGVPDDAEANFMQYRDKILKLVEVVTLLNDLGIQLTGSNFQAAEIANIKKAIAYINKGSAERGIDGVPMPDLSNVFDPAKLAKQLSGGSEKLAKIFDSPEAKTGISGALGHLIQNIASQFPKFIARYSDQFQMSESGGFQFKAPGGTAPAHYAVTDAAASLIVKDFVEEFGDKAATLLIPVAKDLNTKVQAAAGGGGGSGKGPTGGTAAGDKPEDDPFANRASKSLEKLLLVGKQYQQAVAGLTEAEIVKVNQRLEQLKKSETQAEILAKLAGLEKERFDILTEASEVLQGSSGFAKNRVALGDLSSQGPLTRQDDASVKRYNQQIIAATKLETTIRELTIAGQQNERQVISTVKEQARQGQVTEALTQNMRKEIDAKLQNAQAGKAATNSIKAQMQEQVNAQRAVQKQTQSLMQTWVTSRYALYDIGNFYQNVAQNLIRVSRQIFDTTESYRRFESSFTSVERAMQLTGTAALDMRNQFVLLSETIPVAFEEIARIGTLGAQMGIASDGIIGFTKTVSQFASITGISAETVAQQFGRIAELADVDPTEFDNLGSAVAFAGINAVATEAEILNLTQSIAAVSNQAGITAPEIVGIATALASVGIQSEQARGVFTRVFADIDRAARGGGESLQALSEVTGMSAETISSSWGTEGAANEVFIALLQGLDAADNLTAAFDKLNIVETREINTLTRLAKNLDVVSQALSDSNSSFEDATFLGTSFERTVDNLDSKITLFKNNLDSLAAALSSGFALVLGQVLDVGSEFLKFLKDAEDSILFKGVLPFAAVLTAFAAGLAAFSAVTAKVTAQVYAFRVAMVNMANNPTAVEGIVRQTKALMGLGSGLIEVRDQVSGINERGLIEPVNFNSSLTNVKKQQAELLKTKNIYLSMGDVAKETMDKETVRSFTSVQLARKEADAVNQLVLAKRLEIEALENSQNPADIAKAATMRQAFSQAYVVSVGGEIRILNALELQDQRNVISSSNLSRAKKAQALAHLDNATAINLETKAASNATGKIGSFLSRAVGIAAIVGTAVVAVDMLTKSFENMGKVDLLESGGGLESLKEAIKKDTLAVENGTMKAVATAEIEYAKYVKTTDSAAVAIKTLTGLSDDAAFNINKVTEEFEKQSIAIGENTKEWIANALYKALEEEDIEFTAIQKSMQELGMDFDTLLKDMSDAASGEDINPLRNLDSELDRLKARRDELGRESIKYTNSARPQAITDELTEIYSQISAYEDLKNVLSSLGIAFQEAFSKSSMWNAIKDVLDLSEAENGILALVDRFKEAQESGKGFKKVFADLKVSAIALTGATGDDLLEIKSQETLLGLRAVLQGMLEAAKAASILEVRTIKASKALVALKAADKLEIESIEDAIASLDAIILALGTSVESVGGATETMAEKIARLLDEASSGTEKVAAFRNSIRALGKAMAESTSFNLNEALGATNISALLDVIDSIGARSGSVNKTVRDLQIFKLVLQDMKAPGVAIKQVEKALESLGGSTNITKKRAALLRREFANLFNTFQTNFTAGAAEITSDVENKVKSLTDYVGELGNVLRSTFDIRYGNQTALDALTGAWLGLTEAASQAEDAVKNANNEINQSVADRTVLQYQLSVAERYKDEKRSVSLRAKLAELDQKIVEQNKQLSEANDAASTSLTGNSKAAIDNRAKVRDLVTQYNSYLIALANTNMNSTDLNAEAAKLETEFMNQAKALGFAEEELKSYTQAFKGDFTKVINGIPRDITLTVNTDPALRAIQEFVAQAKAALSQISITAPAGPVTLPGQKPTEQFFNLPGLTNTRPGPEIDGKKGDIVTGPKGATWAWDNKNKKWDKIAKKAMGGYISGPGSATSDSIPAMVSNGEYVIQARAVSAYGLDFMNALNQQRVGFSPMQGSSAMGGGGSSVVYLSPEDRALLRAAVDRPIALYTENTKIAQSANAGNVVLAQRGSN